MGREKRFNDRGKINWDKDGAHNETNLHSKNPELRDLKKENLFAACVGSRPEPR